MNKLFINEYIDMRYPQKILIFISSVLVSFAVYGAAITITSGMQIDGSTLTLGAGNVISAANSGTVTSITMGTGLASTQSPLTSSGTMSSNAVYQMAFQPGLLTSVTNTKSVFGKASKASTVDNIEGSAFLFSCVSNPTITFYECGTSASCSSSPTTIGSVTVTSAGTVVDGTINNSAITAGDYVAWAISSGTCTSLDIAATAQVHSN